ncbi:hypothetical protein MKX01_013864 [Papaver californicum]|nr:hypothetical protein MKX01_013864 [Papaver californicum]
MDIEMVKCECCGLKEDCTQDYITEVKAKFDGKCLCGLCAEALHMSFCRKFKSNPANRVADGTRQILRRRSGINLTSSTSTWTSTPKKYTRSSSTSQVGHVSTTSFTLY